MAPSEDPKQEKKEKPSFSPIPPGGNNWSAYIKGLIYFLILISLPVTLFFLGSQGQYQEKQLSIKKVVELAQEGRIAKLVIRYETLGSPMAIEARGLLTDSEPSKSTFTTSGLVFESDMKVFQNHVPELKVEKKSDYFSSFLFFFGPVILLFLLVWFLISRQMRNAGRSALQFGKSRARLAQPSERVTFADVAGIDHAREEVMEIVQYLRDPDKYHQIGARIPHGVLLVGPPGTGKTLLARAIAGEAGVPFFSISGSDFVEMFVGVGASRVRDMFEQAKKHAPCIVFIDEIDAVGRSRFSGIGGGHDEREQTLNALLVEMDGFERKSGIIVMAATNRPDVLDKALLRPGRFDRQVYVELPDLVGRKEIIQVHLKKVKTKNDINLDQLARSTPGFSGADLENLINEAALIAARKGKDMVENEDFEEARDKVMYGKERPIRAMSDHDKLMIAYHEAGHALVSIYCKHADPLHKVTVIPRGKMLGGAMYFPEGEKVVHTKSELLDRMVVGCAGRCAEEMVFGEQTTGDYGDIRQVSSIARAIVTRFGMNPRLGFIEYATTDEDLGYLGHLSKPEYSEQTAQLIDEEVRQLVQSALQKAKAILEEHRDQLDLLATTLKERETLSGIEVYQLLNLPIPPALLNASLGEKKISSSEGSVDRSKATTGESSSSSSSTTSSEEPPLTGEPVLVNPPPVASPQGNLQSSQPSPSSTDPIT